MVSISLSFYIFLTPHFYALHFLEAYCLLVFGFISADC